MIQNIQTMVKKVYNRLLNIRQEGLEAETGEKWEKEEETMGLILAVFGRYIIFSFFCFVIVLLVKKAI